MDDVCWTSRKWAAFREVQQFNGRLRCRGSAAGGGVSCVYGAGVGAEAAVGGVAGVQQVAVPLCDACNNDWVREAVADLYGASEALVPATGRLGRFMRPSSPRALLGCELGAALAGKLPVNLQDQFASAAAFDEGDNPMGWARRTSCLFDLIVDPLRALAELDRQERRTV
jgi:hypothetical protein